MTSQAHRPLISHWLRPAVLAQQAYPVASADGLIKLDAMENPYRWPPDMIEDWLQCLRTRQTPNASIEAGYQHAVACLMGVRSFDTGQRMVYDKHTREIIPG